MFDGSVHPQTRKCVEQLVAVADRQAGVEVPRGEATLGGGNSLGVPQLSGGSTTLWGVHTHDWIGRLLGNGMLEFPTTSSRSRAWQSFWVCERMFDGSVHPRNLVNVSEYSPVLR
jgi:hypothetical protein